MKETGKKDWTMTKSRYFPDEEWERRYVWVGPKGTGTMHVCLGTEDSALFLKTLWTLYHAYRATAHALDHSEHLPSRKAAQERTV